MISPFLFLTIFVAFGNAIVNCEIVVSKSARFTNFDCQEKCNRQDDDFFRFCESTPNDCYSNIILGLPTSGIDTRVTTPQECQQACQNELQCFRFVFVNDSNQEGNNCFLKGEEEIREILGSPVGSDGSKLCPEELVKSLEEWEMPLLECSIGRLCAYKSDAFTTGPKRCNLQVDILKQSCPVLGLNTMSDCEKANGPVEIIHIMDLTKEFKDDLENLQSELADVLEYIDTTLSAGSSFAMTTFRDKPTGFLGMPDDFCYRLEFTFDDPTETKLEKVASLHAAGGLDWPENQIGAIWETLDDKSISFREDTTKIIIVATDSESHEAGVEYPWGSFPPFCPTCDTNRCSEQDYPSREDLKIKLKESDVDAIFFVVHQNFDTLSHVSVQLFYEQLLEDIGIPGSVIWLFTGRNQWKDILRKSLEEFENICPTDNTTTPTEELTTTTEELTTPTTTTEELTTTTEELTTTTEELTTPTTTTEELTTTTEELTTPTTTTEELTTTTEELTTTTEESTTTTEELTTTTEELSTPTTTTEELTTTTEELSTTTEELTTTTTTNTTTPTTLPPKPTAPEIDVTVPPPGGEWRPTPPPKPTLPPKPDVDVTVPPPGGEWRPTQAPKPTLPPKPDVDVTVPPPGGEWRPTPPPKPTLPLIEITPPNQKPTMSPEWDKPKPSWTHPPELDFLYLQLNN